MSVPRASKSRILVVDDEPALRRLLRAYLDKEGFEVLEAAGGQQALALFRSGDVDLAVIDVMLPELDGFEVVRRIRTRSSAPIILLTARGEETNRVAGLELGGVEVDRTSRRCTVGGRPVELTRREFDLLLVLLERSGRALTREQLLEAAWGTTYVSAKTVDVHVAGLRRKLGDAVQISSLRGIGYRLER